MKYQLADFDPARFRKLDDLVRLCFFDLSQVFKSPIYRLGQIGTTTEGLTPDDVKYVESNNSPVAQLNGVCFHGSGSKVFKIWMNPDMAPGSLLYELVLMHELCHGYLGPQMHSRTWRRFFGRAILLYAELLNPSFKETDPEWQVKHTIRRYRGEQHPHDNYGDLVYHSELELEAITEDMERNITRLCQDFNQLQEMRQGCHGSSSNSTPTRVYLASALKKAGTESLSI